MKADEADEMYAEEKEVVVAATAYRMAREFFIVVPLCFLQTQMQLVERRANRLF